MHFITGFIKRDGSFSLRLSPSFYAKLGEECFIIVSIVQHNRSLIVA